MELYELVLKNRSYRSYDANYAVTKEELIALVECARLCPASANRQMLRYRLCAGTGEMEKVLKHTKWAAALPDWHFPPTGHEPTAAVVICHDKTVAPSENASATDVGIAAQTILLAAAEKGLGGCMIGNFGRADLQAELGLPSHVLPVLVVAIGKPDETIILETLKNGEPTAYYRDENGVHHVPKRAMEDILV